MGLASKITQVAQTTTTSSTKTTTYDPPSQLGPGTQQTYVPPSQPYSTPQQTSYAPPSQPYPGTQQTSYAPPSQLGPGTQPTSYAPPSQPYPGTQTSYGGSSQPYPRTQQNVQAGLKNDSNFLYQKLNTIVNQNGLQQFYDQNKLNNVLQKVSLVDFDSIVKDWKLPKELVYELATLALYDIVLFIDDSGSMRFEDGGERIDDLKFIISQICGVITKFDNDGITLRFFNESPSPECNGITSEAQVQQIISKLSFSGVTPLGTEFNKRVIQPFVMSQVNSRSLNKPILAIVITDGEPSDGRNTMTNVIRDAKGAITRAGFPEKSFAIEIAQVGKDPRAQAYLAELDNHPEVGSLIDCTSYFELEAEEFKRKSGTEMTPYLWLIKLLLGAVDKSYDDQD
jgi:hypothetical protein